MTGVIPVSYTHLGNNNANDKNNGTNGTNTSTENRLNNNADTATGNDKNNIDTTEAVSYTHLSMMTVILWRLSADFVKN